MKTLKITKVQNQMTRTGQHGDFTLQGGTATDLDTNTEVNLMFNGMDDQKHLLNKTVIVSNVKDGEYNGKPQITINKKSEIKDLSAPVKQPQVTSQQSQPETYSPPQKQFQTEVKAHFVLGKEKRAVELVKFFMSELKSDIQEEATRADVARSLAATVLINEK